MPRVKTSAEFHSSMLDSIVRSAERFCEERLYFVVRKYC